MKIKPISQIIITNNFDEAIKKLKEVAKDCQFELFIKENSNFLVSDVNEVISKAYLTSEKKVFFILATEVFSEIVQNRLLKIIEEPPKNKEFVLLTPNKSALLPTITSRLPLIELFFNNSNSFSIELDINNLNLHEVYEFIKKNKYIKPTECIALIENIIKEALFSNRYNLDEKSLEVFKNIRVAISLGGNCEFLLNTLFLKLLSKKVKK